MTTQLIPPERVYERIIHWADRLPPRADQKIGCLVSKYSVGSHGYAQIGWKEGGERTVTLAHLVLWRYLEGLVPDGMTVDHECKTKKCVERSHLRLLTNYDNARRTSGRDWPLGECINGHPDSEQFMQGKRRRCRPCNVVYQREYKERKKQREQLTAPPSSTKGVGTPTPSASNHQVGDKHHGNDTQNRSTEGR